MLSPRITEALNERSECSPALNRVHWDWIYDGDLVHSKLNRCGLHIDEWIFDPLANMGAFDGLVFDGLP